MQQDIKFIKDFPSTTDFRYEEDLWKKQHGNSFVILDCKASHIYYPEHWTPFSLKFAFNGKEHYKLKNRSYAVTDHNFLVLNEGSRYASFIDSTSVTDSFTLNFTQANLDMLATVSGSSTMELLDNPFDLAGGTRVVEKLYAYTPDLAKDIQQLRWLGNQAIPDSFAVIGLLYSILEKIFELNSQALSESEKIGAKKQATREELYKRLTIVKDFIDSCYAEQITLDLLSSASFLNSFYLLREFKKLYGITPHQYLMQTRLSQAVRLLLQSDKPVRTIVEEVGYEDVNSFNRLFKINFGSSPAEYRLRK